MDVYIDEQLPSAVLKWKVIEERILNVNTRQVQLFHKIKELDTKIELAFQKLQAQEEQERKREEKESIEEKKEEQKSKLMEEKKSELIQKLEEEDKK